MRKLTSDEMAGLDVKPAASRLSIRFSALLDWDIGVAATLAAAVPLCIWALANLI